MNSSDRSNAAPLPASSAPPRFRMHALGAYDAKQLEFVVREYWAGNEIPRKLAERRAGRKKFYLLDGPPYVNADPHVGHVKTTACKDIWTRYQYMQGFDAHVQAGFDTHGLPVEVVVQKELGIQNKSDVAKMGIGKFDAKCLEKVENNEKTWMEYYGALGAWRAWFPPYFTYKKSYIESAWWTLKTLHDKGFLREGEAPSFWCPRCETVLSGYEVSDSYKDVTDPSLYVKFRVKGEKDTFLLVWTTTPWTLPSNVAIFAAPDEPYVKAKVVTSGGRAEHYLLAKARLQAVLGDLGKLTYEVEREFNGAELDGLAYEPLLDVKQQRALAGTNAHRVYLSIPILKRKKYKKHKMSEEAGAREGAKAGAESAKAGSPGRGAGKDARKAKFDQAVKTQAAKLGDEGEYEDFVTMADGTGLVHAAPGHGHTDYAVGKHYGLPAVSPVDEQGKFTDAVEPWTGQFVKSADKDIVQRLEDEGKALYYSRVTHAYPLCWRCKTPLIYRLTKQWYLSIDLIKEKMLEDNERTNWMPAFGRDAFRNWLELSQDWVISRQRFWAIPLPIWRCGTCAKIRVVASARELEENSTTPIPPLQDLHRHSVDGIRLACTCGSEMKRVEDVFDVWFDSGIAPWASLGYPYKNKELFEHMFPVDLVNESQDQIRGWFYTLSFAAQAAFGKPAFKNCAMMGWVVDAKGEKMSKSVGNVVPAMEGIEKLGADAIRLYYCWETAPWDVQKFSFQTAEEAKRALAIAYNALAFYQTYAPPGFQPEPVTDARIAAWKQQGVWKAEDAWLLSRLNALALGLPSLFNAFEFHNAGRALVRFAVDEFSRWYVKLVRDRAAPSASDDERTVCLSALHHVLLEFSKLAHPILPFTTEYVYQHLGGGKESVSFDDYPTGDSARIDADLEADMALAMKITEASNAARQEAKIKLRWPVREVRVAGAGAKRCVERLQDVLQRSTNAQKITAVEGKPAGAEWAARDFDGGTVFVSTARDAEMEASALFRELTRAIQAERKKRAFNVNQRIALSVFVTAASRAFFEKNQAELLKAVGGASVDFADDESAVRGEYSVEAALDENKAKAAFEEAP